MTFPEGWPNDCPPAEAIDASGMIFRIVNREPPAPEDFVSHFEAGKLPKAPPCLRCGLSVFQELGDAIHQRRLLPKLGRLIARGEVFAQHGKIKLATGKQPTHTTWWAYRDVNRASLFSIVPEEG
jgi:hypothetical protein